MASGVAFFNQTAPAGELLRGWAEAIAHPSNQAKVADDQLLSLLINFDGWIARTSLGWLPERYLRMPLEYFDSIQQRFGPVILHDRGNPAGTSGRGGTLSAPVVPPHIEMSGVTTSNSANAVPKQCRAPDSPLMWAILHAQNPPLCTNRTFAVIQPATVGPKSIGFAATMQVLSRCLARTVHSGITLAVNGPYGNYDSVSDSGGVMKKLFLPITSCTVNESAQAQSIAQFDPLCKRGVVWPTEQVSKLNISPDEWQGRLLLWLMRPSAWLAEHLQRTRRRIFGSDVITKTPVAIGVHIRRGDKITAEHRTPVAASIYIHAAVNLARAAKRQSVLDPLIPVPNVLFVATDEPDFEGLMTQLQNALADHIQSDSSLPPLRILSQGAHLMRNTSTATKILGMSNYLSILNRNHVQATGVGHTSERAAIEISTEIHLLSECSYLVGTCSSQVGMTAAYMRVARFAERGHRVPHAAIRLDQDKTQGHQGSQELWSREVNFDAKRHSSEGGSHNAT